MIDNYYIDDENNLHCFVCNMEDVIISKVYSDEEAIRLIDELNDERKENKNEKRNAK